MKQGEIALALEFFDLENVVQDDCLNYALYSGR